VLNGQDALGQKRKKLAELFEEITDKDLKDVLTSELEDVLSFLESGYREKQAASNAVRLPVIIKTRDNSKETKPNVPSLDQVSATQNKAFSTLEHLQQTHGYKGLEVKKAHSSAKTINTIQKLPTRTSINTKGPHPEEHVLHAHLETPRDKSDDERRYKEGRTADVQNRRDP